VDQQTGVSVRFVVAGEPIGKLNTGLVTFPHPEEISENEDGVQFANLPTLVTLKLAAGLGMDRARDVADIQELIKTAFLTESLASQLHCDVREHYVRMCRAIEAGSGPFLRVVALASPSERPRSIHSIVAADSADARALAEMRHDGVELFTTRPFYERFAVLASNDRHVARKYDMHHESEYLFYD